MVVALSMGTLPNWSLCAAKHLLVKNLHRIDLLYFCANNAATTRMALENSSFMRKKLAFIVAVRCAMLDAPFMTMLYFMLAWHLLIILVDRFKP